MEIKSETTDYSCGALRIHLMSPASQVLLTYGGLGYDGVLSPTHLRELASFLNAVADIREQNAV